jgi:hypothetical protein
MGRGGAGGGAGDQELRPVRAAPGKQNLWTIKQREEDLSKKALKKISLYSI